MSFEKANEKNYFKAVFLRQLQKNSRISVRGISMEPTLYEGDVVNTEICDKYDIGDIVIALDDPCRLLIHRIVGIEFSQNGNRIYILKGDNAELCERVPENFCLAKVGKI